MMRYGYGYGCGNNIMGGWFGVMFIFIILIGIVIFLFYRKGHNNGHDVGNRDNSFNILDERFARGEINEDEYNQRKNFLSNHK